MRRHNKIAKLSALIVVLLFIVGIYWLASIGCGQSVNFQEYKPTLLPTGVATTNGEFYVLRNKGFLPTFDKHININFNLANSWLAEWRSNGHLTNPCSDFPNETDCHNYVTAKHQHYQLAGSADSKQPGPYAYDVRFIKGNTEIWITVLSKQSITNDTWGSVVDSFHPGHYDGLKVIHGSSSGP